MFARLHFILQSEMPACNVTLPVMGETQKLTLYEPKIYVLVFLMLLSLTASFQNALKYAQNRQKNAYKTSKDPSFAAGAPPQNPLAAGGVYDAPLGP